MRTLRWTLLSILVACNGCAYRVVVGPLRPAGEQGSMRVADDGTVTYVNGRLEIALRPMLSDELNRQFASASGSGRESTNPYTYGDWLPAGQVTPPPRFTVFRLTVKNYEFPKVLVDPSAIIIRSQNRRTYTALTFDLLKEYYAPYNTAYAGRNYKDYDERKDILRQTLFPEKHFLFSGQELEGYVVLPVVHEDVTALTVTLKGVALRFDAWGLPTETVDVDYRFERTVGRS